MSDVLHTLEQTAAAEPAFLERLRLRARRRVLWMRSMWSAAQPGMQGLAIADAEVDRILADPLVEAEARFYRTDPEARGITREIERAEENAARDEHWSRLVREFQLTGPEADLMSLALAVEADPWWRRVCGYLHDDATAGYATLWLARGLFGWTNEVRLGPESALVRWQLARPAEGTANPWSGAAPWTADPHLAAWLLGGPLADPLLGASAEFAVLDSTAPCLYPDTLRAIRDVVVRIAREGTTTLEVELIGPDGSGRQTLAAQLCAGIGLEMLTINADGPEVPDRALRAARLVRLAGAALYWRAADRVDPKALRSVRGEQPLVFYGCETYLPLSTRAGVTRLSFELPRLTERERREFWTNITGTPAPGFIAENPLRPREIAAAAQAAAAGDAAVEHACRVMLRHPPGDLLTALPLPYTWDDIVLTEPLRRHLQEFESQARLRTQVLEEWGFERLTPLGRGINALFSGPSGTGKTMAAQVLARELGLEIRRVDLSSVVNKYIGETEKRLKQVFDVCERDRVVLFFDEADALFGQRTQVKDAHDRFANIEINYLLQRMEQFDGIAILATNRKEDLDRAFLRRLRFIIEFLPPGPAERLVLWRKSLPERTPYGIELLEGPIAWDKLASQLDLTGAAIKASALRAAFLARSESARIGMRHILAAARREMQKQGQVLRSGELEDLR